MKLSHITIIVFLGVLIGCTSNKKSNSDILKSYQNTISFTNSTLEERINGYHETLLKDCIGFSQDHKKGMIIHDISKKYYKLLDSIYSNQTISTDQINFLKNEFRKTLDSLKIISKDGPFSDKNFIDNDYYIDNKSKEHLQLIILMLKNDLILNEINSLDRIHSYYHRVINMMDTRYVVAVPASTLNNSNYTIKVLFVYDVSSKKLDRKISIESLTRNQIPIPFIHLIDTSFSDEYIHFKPLKNGSYELKGKLIVNDKCVPGSEREFDFNHTFSIK